MNQHQPRAPLAVALERLEAAWAGARAPILSALNPPATEVEIEQAAWHYRPQNLHADIQAWWRWHNGSAPDGPTVGPAPWRLLDTVTSTQVLQSNLEIAESVGLENGQASSYFWEPTWTPIAVIGGGETQLAVDAVTGHVRSVRWEFGDFREVKAESLSVVADVWSELIEQRIVKLEKGRWQVTDSQHPLFRRFPGIADA